MEHTNHHFNGIDYVCECGKHFGKKRSLTVQYMQGFVHSM